jgi:hypothetical protein
MKKNPLATSIGFKNLGFYELRTENMLCDLNVDSVSNMLTSDDVKTFFVKNNIFENVVVYTQNDIILVEYELKVPMYSVYFDDKNMNVSVNGDLISLDYYRNEFNLPNVIVNDIYNQESYQELFELFTSIDLDIPCFKVSEIYIDSLGLNKHRREILIAGVIDLEKEIAIEVTTLFSNYKLMFRNLIPCIEQFLKKSPQKNTIDGMKLDMRFKQHVVCYE